MSSIDPTKPYNNLPLIPPANVDFETPAILKASLEAAGAIGELRASIWTDPSNAMRALDMVRPLFVPEAVTSSAVENIVTTNEKVYEAQTEASYKQTPAEKEAIRYVDALTRGIYRLADRAFLNTNDFITLQEILEPTRSGIRSFTGTHLSNPATGEIYYTPPEGEKLIRSLLANYERYLNDKAPLTEVYARMAILHYQFEAIHPFPDGNGRTGRMLMPLYLMLQGQLDIPVLFISRYILNNRDEYYQRLRAVTLNGEWEAWILYIIQATTQQARYTSGVLRKVRNTIEMVTADIKKNLPAVYRPELVDFIFSEPYFDVAYFQKQMGISYATARKYLDLLEQGKYLSRKRQNGRNRYLYANPRYLNILKQS
ncbi:MAG TPA: Fic family protein [Candidatus Saccharimonadia bacterium]|nr:Fic family protein [Candidatus Saccharimonadia bacterium]